MAVSAPAFLSLPNIAVRLTYYSAGQSIWHKAEGISRYFKVSLNLQGMKSLLHGRITGALSFAVFEIAANARNLTARPDDFDSPDFTIRKFHRQIIHL